MNKSVDFIPKWGSSAWQRTSALSDRVWQVCKKLDVVNKGQGWSDASPLGRAASDLTDCIWWPAKAKNSGFGHLISSWFMNDSVLKSKNGFPKDGGVAEKKAWRIKMTKCVIYKGQK